MPEDFVFGTENLSESIRQDFEGKVVHSEFPCHCEECEGGNKEYDRDGWHLKMEPVDGTYEKVQNEWFYPSESVKSKWGKFNEFLEEIGKLKDVKELISEGGYEALEGLVFTWSSVEIEYGADNSTTQVWVPVEFLGEEAEEQGPDLS